MTSLFKKHKRTPKELALKLANALNTLKDSGDTKDQESCGKYLADMRAIMYGDGEHPPDPTLQSQLTEAVHAADGLLASVVIHLPKLFFETRKHAAAVFNALVRHPLEPDERLPFIAELESRPDVVERCLTGSELGDQTVGNDNTALTYGTMLREMARYEPLCRRIVQSPGFAKMLEYMQAASFEIASDAAASFREILTRHKALISEYFESNHVAFFGAYNQMLEKGNYVTRRQSLKLLSELLLDRANLSSMLRYIGDVENLCLMMNLLRDEARSIQFEAFHVFKVFVANPQKPTAVIAILKKNREKLIGYLANFQNDREDEQFAEEKAMLTRLLEQMGDDDAAQ